MQQTLEDLFQQAILAFQAADWPQAESLFKELTEQWPDCIEAWFQLGELYQLQQRWDQALFYYEQVLARNDQIQEVWLNLGRIAIQQNQPPVAQQYWQRALAVNPDYSEAHFHLGLLLVKQGEMAQAVGHLMQTLKNSPELAQDFLALIQEYAQQGQSLESLALADALVIQGCPESELAQWLKIPLLQDLGADATAFSLAELTDALAQWLTLYLPMQTAPTPEQEAQWPERLSCLNLTQLSEQYGPYLPRLRSWFLFGLPAPERPSPINAAKNRSALPGPIRQLVWLVDSRSSCWQDWALQHFRALPSTWQITVVLRFASLQSHLLPDYQGAVQVLPSDPEAARQLLADLQPDVILWGDPDLDPLQHWLSKHDLADLQLAWSGRSLGFEAESSIQGHLPQWPLYPLPSGVSAESKPMPLSERPLLICPLPAMGLLPVEKIQLELLAESYQLLVLANPSERPLLQQLQQAFADRPNQADQPDRQEQAPIFKIWQQSKELIPWFEQARALYLPQKSAELYALLARHYGLACCRLQAAPLPWGPTYAANQIDDLPVLEFQPEDWLKALPATRWAVELQAALYQRRNP